MVVGLSCCDKVNKGLEDGAGEKAQVVRSNTASAEDQGSVPSPPHWVAHNCLKLQFLGSQTIFWPLQACARMCTHTGKKIKHAHD